MSCNVVTSLILYDGVSISMLALLTAVAFLCKPGTFGRWLAPYAMAGTVVLLATAAANIVCSIVLDYIGLPQL